MEYRNAELKYYHCYILYPAQPPSACSPRRPARVLSAKFHLTISRVFDHAQPVSSFAADPSIYSEFALQAPSTPQPAPAGGAYAAAGGGAGGVPSGIHDLLSKPPPPPAPAPPGIADLLSRKDPPRVTSPRPPTPFPRQGKPS